MDPLRPSRKDPSLSIKSAIWILVSLSAVFLALRLYCKRRGSGFHWDDTILVASWTALLGYVILATIIFDTVNAQRNSGLPISTDALNRLATLGICSTTLAITTQSWSKTSFAITLLRISDGWLSYFLWAVIVSMNVLFGLGALFLWVGCSPLEKAWHPRVAGTCWDPSFNVVFGIVICGNVLLSVLPRIGSHANNGFSILWCLGSGAGLGPVEDHFAAAHETEGEIGLRHCYEYGLYVSLPSCGGFGCARH